MAGTAEKLVYLYPTSIPLVDWIVTNDGKPGSPDVIAYWSENERTGPQPSEAELAALTDSQVKDGNETHKAKKEKAAATQGIDDAFAKKGNRVERALMGVALSIAGAVNNDREAMAALKDAIVLATTLPDLKARVGAIDFPPQVTEQQVVNAVKAAIAETPE